MSRRADSDPHIGQQFQRTDPTAYVFEVVEPVTSYTLPHIRVRRVDDPTDIRVFALSALMDRHLFKAVQGGALPTHSESGQLRLISN